MDKKNNLPITGIASFGKYPICTDFTELDADFAILGVPYDLGVSFLSGARLGPRALRETSTQYSPGPEGFYDLERDEVFLAEPVKIADIGDADIISGDIDKTFDNIEESVRKIVEMGAVPVILGGDHSISIPVARALDQVGPVTVVQFDAHLDWSDAPGGQRYGNGSPMRRMSEMDHIGKMAQIGLRGFGSSTREDFDEARQYGSELIPAQEAHHMTAEEIAARIPEAENYYVTIDMDGFDISIAPGVGAPSPGGLGYMQVMDILYLLAKKGNIIAFDLVEVAPQYDPTNTTNRVAAMVILEFMGLIANARADRKKKAPDRHGFLKT